MQNSEITVCSIWFSKTSAIQWFCSYKLLYSTSLPRVLVVSPKSAELWHLEQNTCTESKIISESHTVYSPHCIFKRWKVFSQAGKELLLNTSQAGDKWPWLSKACATLTWFGCAHSRLMKPGMNLPSQAFCLEAPRLFQWKNNVLWFQRIPVPFCFSSDQLSDYLNITSSIK